MDWLPTVLVIGPGGIKGFLYLGSLLVLESDGYLEKIKTYVGVSIGAIIALLLVAGYSVTEAVDTNLFQDISCLNWNEVKTNTGLISNRPIKEKLITCIENKYGKLLNLHELYQATGLEFMCVTMNLDMDRAEYLSWKNYPNMSCVDAVLLSMNIPLLFYKLKYNGCVYIDGAFGNPYPIDQYDDGKTDILGLYLTLSSPERHFPIDSHLVLYLYKIIDSSMTQIRERIIRGSSDRCKHLAFLSPTFDTTGLTIDIKMKSEMIITGYITTKQFLEKLSKNNKEVIIVDSEDLDKDVRIIQPLSPRIRKVINTLIEN